ncbi:hypothetical protein NBRC116494_09770 [Aurantivibrio plasticivorans]
MARRLIQTTLLVGISCLSSLGASQDSNNDEEQTAPAVTTSRPPPQQSEMEQMRLLAKSLPKEHVKWLKVADKYFLTKRVIATSAKPKGWIVILPDAGEKPGSPGTLATLEQFLPSKGWNILSLSLPAPHIPDPPARPQTTSSGPRGESEDSEQAAESTESDEPQAGPNEKNEIFDDSTNSIGDGSFIPEEEREPEQSEKTDQEQIVQDRIIAALEFITSEANSGSQLILYGQGAGAARVANYFAEVGRPNRLTAVILVNARNSIPHQASGMTTLLGNVNLPLLDIVSAPSPEQRHEAEQRSRVARRNGLRYYEQRTVITPPYDNTNRAVWGFLSRKR